MTDKECKIYFKDDQKDDNITAVKIWRGQIIDYMIKQIYDSPQVHWIYK